MSLYSKEDLRYVKTEKALSIAMFTLLENRKFKKITVRDICEEALISRATFYTHFSDKYDLLEYWLVYLRPRNIIKDDSYELKEKKINQFIYKNATVIKNLFYDADDETLKILFNSILSIINLSDEKTGDKNINLKYTISSNFFAGGMIYYLLW